MTVSILVVEDHDEWIDAVRGVLESIGLPFTLTEARSKAAALGKLAECFFDLVILDLRIPAQEGGLDAAPIHGMAVLTAAADLCPGTPLIVLTVEAPDDLFAAIIRRHTKVDIWGEGHPIDSLEFVLKREADSLTERLAAPVRAVSALRDVELEASGDLLLTPEEGRLLRIFGKRVGGALCRVEELTNGLSGVRALRVVVTDPTGATVHRAFVKIGERSEIARENAAYDAHVSRLSEWATPRRFALLEFGARKSSALFYRFVEEFPASLFSTAQEDDARGARAVESARLGTVPWSDGVSQRSMLLKDVRRRLVTDAQLEDIATASGLGPDVAALEAIRAQVRWCCIHGDLHGENIRVAGSGAAVCIDFAEVGEGPAGLDPLTLELSFVFHLRGPARGSQWPSVEQAEQWWDLPSYLIGCPFPATVTACREWARAAVASEREMASAVYSYALRQLRYDDTPRDLVLAFLRGARARLEAT